MAALLFLLYLGVEIAALAALAQGVGILWTVVIVAVVWVVGLQLVRAQGRRALDGLRLASAGERAPGGAVADGALIGVGALLMLIPGLVTSVFGALLLAPPTRWLMRPLAVFLVSRRLGVLATASTVFTRGGGEVIDGEVLDGEVLDGEVIDVPADRTVPNRP